jgi:hypothetical protein
MTGACRMLVEHGHNHPFDNTKSLLHHVTRIPLSLRFRSVIDTGMGGKSAGFLKQLHTTLTRTSKW